MLLWFIPQLINKKNGGNKAKKKRIIEIGIKCPTKTNQKRSRKRRKPRFTEDLSEKDEFSGNEEEEEIKRLQENKESKKEKENEKENVNEKTKNRLKEDRNNEKVDLNGKIGGVNNKSKSGDVGLVRCIYQGDQPLDKLPEFYEFRLKRCTPLIFKDIKFFKQWTSVERTPKIMDYVFNQMNLKELGKVEEKLKRSRLWVCVSKWIFKEITKMRTNRIAAFHNCVKSK